MDNDLLLEALRVIDNAAGLPPEERLASYREQCRGRPDLLAAVLELDAAPGDDRSPVISADRLNQVASELFPEGEGLPDPLLDTRAGPYLILEQIGQGGMGRVYRARDTSLNKIVALKVLTHVHGEQARQRLQREAELLARCTDSSIVGILYSDLLPNGDPYFTMELVEGRSITEFCAAAGLGLRGRLLLFNAVCEGVRVAHSAGVIHRDLKPSNTRVGHDGKVKLLDFGTSEVFGEEDRAIRSYISVAYAAPEHTRRTSVRTDVYSLGVLLAELLLGRLPFDTGDGDPVKLRSRIPAQGMAPLRSWMPAVADTAPWMRGLSRLRWAELEAICARATARDPDQRYNSVEALRTDVQHFLALQPVDARQPRRAYRSWRFFTRHVAAVSITAIITFLLLGLAFLYVWGLRQQRNAAEQQRSAARRDADHNRAFAALLNALLIGNGPVPRDTPMISLLARGMRFAQADKDARERVVLFEVLEQSYQMLGDYPAADEAMQASMAACQDGCRDTPQMAELLAQTASLRVAESKAPAALVDAQQAYALDRRLLQPDAEGRVQAEMELAQVYRVLGQVATAQRLLQDAIAQAQGKPALLADLGTAYNEMSLVANDMGDLPRFYTLLSASLAITRKLEATDNPDIGEALLSLSATASQIGDARQAELYAREALANLTQTLPPDHPDVLAARIMLGIAAAKQGRSMEANAILTPIANGPLAPKVETSERALAEWGLGVSAEHAGQDAKAIAAYTAALRIYRQLYPRPNTKWAACLAGLARVELRQRALAQAEANAQQAVALTSARFSPTSPGLAGDEVLLGEVLLAQHRHEQARQVLTRVVRLRHTPGMAGTWLAPYVDRAEHDMPPAPESAAR